MPLSNANVENQIIQGKPDTHPFPSMGWSAIIPRDTEVKQGKKIYTFETATLEFEPTFHILKCLFT